MNNFGSEKFDIVIQAGQSNSEGCGLGQKELFTPDKDALYMLGDLSIVPAREEGVPGEPVNNFALSFAAEYMKSGRLQSGRKLLILRAAVGGTGFLDKRWGLEDDLFLRMMQMIRTALSLNPENRVVTFIWHQGENDAILNATYETHYKNLKALLDSVRAECKSPKLPFIAADFVHEWKSVNAEICEPVIRAIRAVCSETAAAFIETAGLSSNNQAVGNNDTIHFSGDALTELGRKYYRAFEEISGRG